ncbi:MAG: hypothetical protein ABWX92_18270 [Mycetocola sp.]
MRAHFAAVKARAESDTTLTGKVFDTIKPTDGTAPERTTYVLLFGGGPDLNDGRLTAPNAPTADADYLYTGRCVSTSPDVVRSVQSKMIALFAGHRLIVPNRACSPAEIEAYPVEYDATLNLYFADVDIELHSSRV